MRRWLELAAVALALTGASACRASREAAAGWHPLAAPVWLREPDCDVLREDAWLKVFLDGEVHELEALDHNAPRWVSAWGACRAAPQSLDPSFVLAEGDSCFAGIDRGEWGGEFAIYKKGSKVFSSPVIGPRRLVWASGQRILIQSDMTSEWRLSRLGRNEEGAWELEPIIAWHGHLFGYGKDSRGRLLLAATDGESDAKCLYGLRLYRLLENGRLERFR